MAPGTAPRVLLLCERLDIAGGVERFVCGLADHLATGAGADICNGAGTGADAGAGAGAGARSGAREARLAVAVGSVGTDRSRLAYALSADVQVLEAPPHPRAGGPRWWRLLRAQWHTGRSLGRLIEAQAPDVVVLNGLATACSVLLTRPSIAARSIACDHNHFGARSAPWRWLRSRLYPRLAAVVSLTDADRANFARLNPRTRVIANASTLRAERPACPEAPGVLAVGRLVAQKGIDLLLRSWVEVAARLPQARLRIVGDGPLAAPLQALAAELGIADSVRWSAPTDDIAPIYRAAAVFVLPSRYEGMPLALLEAQALGLPAVAFDCPTGPSDILAADTGVLVAPGDTAALAEALLRLLQDPPLRAAMGAAAIARSRARFSPEAHLRAWTDLVQAVAAESIVGRA